MRSGSLAAWLALALAVPVCARASLGGMSDTVQADQASMHATRHVANRAGLRCMS